MASGTHCELSRVERTDKKMDSMCRSMRSAIDSTMSAKSCGLSDMLYADILMMIVWVMESLEQLAAAGRGDVIGGPGFVTSDLYPPLRIILQMFANLDR